MSTILEMGGLPQRNSSVHVTVQGKGVEKTLETNKMKSIDLVCGHCYMHS